MTTKGNEPSPALFALLDALATGKKDSITEAVQKLSWEDPPIILAEIFTVCQTVGAMSRQVHKKEGGIFSALHGCDEPGCLTTRQFFASAMNGDHQTAFALWKLIETGTKITAIICSMIISAVPIVQAFTKAGQEFNPKYFETPLNDDPPPDHTTNRARSQALKALGNRDPLKGDKSW